MYKINHANIKEWAKNYDGPLFDGILCDPPYELGFMGKSWDSSGIAFDTEMWADIYKLLKPGAHLLAFSGSRTYHRMAVAIEDAGFEIRDMIEWVYGSGFPKSLNIGKAVDKIQGNERQVLGERKVPDQRGGGINSQRTAEMGVPTRLTQDTKGTSEWEGYGTALKPAHEPCVLARKPIEGTVANNVLKHGTGGLNIDQCRVPTQEDQRRPSKGGNNGLVGSNTFKIRERKVEEQTQHTGRFPANLIHDGSDEVEAVFPQTGASKAAPRGGQGFHNSLGRPDRPRLDSNIVRGHTDNGGSASRFFYTAKASKSERNAGLEGFEEVQTTGGGGLTANVREDGSLETASAGGKYGSVKAKQTNFHPTVKPLSLTKYLATLIKPPTGGRLLVPFSGSGSEMIGALQAGWEYVEGVELTEEYIPIAEARIKHWIKEPVQESLL